jgi:K+-sensing histidine kinase KdpD
MKIKNKKTWGDSSALPYLHTTIAVAITFCFRLALHPYLEDRSTLLFFAVTCLTIAYFYGFWPSAVGLFISLPLSIYFFMKPYNSFDGTFDGKLFSSLLFTFGCAFVAYIFEKLRREQYKSTLLMRVAESRFRLLIESDESRRLITSEQNNKNAE